MITSLTGISNEMVRSAPRFAEIAPALGDALRGGVFTAHNAAFDWGFVTAEMTRASGRRLAGRRLCTVRLAGKLLPQLRSRSLDSLSVYFGLDIESRHRAADDALATATVLSRLIEMLDERGVRDWVGVQQLLSRRQPGPKRVAMPRSMESA
jgi:DNA polymerase-3 subunit epsilon